MIDYVSALPEELRYNGIQNKPLLRKVAEKYVHPEILKMPKRGFYFPCKLTFIKTELRLSENIYY
ncbi:asparagine synthase-related protein [Chryseobacterium indoltheticum]|uniref:asparagine synthase-related protein n=1 Tax=Chryseobacterium indoltheticum TaxID=254 RepID=UPI003F493F01